MKTENSRKAFTLILCLLFFAMFAVTAFAKGGGTIKSAKQALGYCVSKGAISHVSESACKQRHGVFFKNKQDAEGYLDVQTPGWCCLSGKVLSMKKGDCLKKKGYFFKGKKEAATYCDLHQTGYCCLDGKVSPMMKGDCLKKRGKFFPTQKAARDTCDPLGWCLLKRKVHHLRKSACEKKKGRFFTKKAEAERAARSVSAGATSSKEKGHKKSTGSAGIVSPGLAGARPYLTVERLYLKKVGNNYLVCVDIKNRGRGKLTKEDYNKGALALRREGSKWHWPLFKVDKKGDLNRGKTVAYTTGAIISTPTTVQISFMHVPGGTKSARLMPPIGTFVKGAKKVPAGAATSSAKPMRVVRKPVGTNMIAVKKMHGRSPSREGLTAEPIPTGGPRPWLTFYTPTSDVGVYTREMEIAYWVSSDISHGEITFTLMHGGHTIGSYRRLYTREDGLTGRRSSLQRFYVLLVSPEVTDDTNYRIIAAMSGHRSIESQPFTISLVSRGGEPGLYCMIVSSEPQFYPDESFFVEAWSPIQLRPGGCELRLEGCELNLNRVSGSEITRVRSIPTDCASSTRIAEVHLNGLSSGLYFLSLNAYVPSIDGSRRRLYSADSRRFRVVERPPVPVHPTSVVDVSEPVGEISWILGNDVPVRWNVVSGWQDGDWLVCRLLRNDTEVRRNVGWTRNGSTQLLSPSVIPDSEGDYRVIVEHHRRISESSDYLITSVTKTIHYIYDPHACTDDRPIHIVDIHPTSPPGVPPGDHFEVGGTMRIVYCHRSAIEDPHIRIVLRNGSTGQEWVLGDRISTRLSSAGSSSLDLIIPSDVPPDTGYRLYVYEVEGTAQSASHAFEISPAP